MDSRAALERLACDSEDWEAILAVYETNFQMFHTAIEKHLDGIAPACQVFFTLVFHVALRAKYFLSGYDEPQKWLEQQVELECQSLRRSLATLNAGMLV